MQTSCKQAAPETPIRKKTAEWLAALESVLRAAGEDRAEFLLSALERKAKELGVGTDLAPYLPYRNSIPLKRQPPFGNRLSLVLDHDAGGWMIAEMDEFLTGARSAPAIDRVLATVVFTAIVDSTKRADTAGDRVWRGLLESHDNTVRRELSRFRGREVKSLGDGFLATFDGPARAIHCANVIRDQLHGLDVPVRIGVHRRG